jgi:hypothetical protein
VPASNTNSRLVVIIVTPPCLAFCNSSDVAVKPPTLSYRTNYSEPSLTRFEGLLGEVREFIGPLSRKLRRAMKTEGSILLLPSMPFYSTRHRSRCTKSIELQPKGTLPPSQAPLRRTSQINVVDTPASRCALRRV